MPTDDQATEPMPPPGQRRRGLHVLRSCEGTESFVLWSQGKWVFWIGHERCDRRSPEDTARYGWQYVRPAQITANGSAS